MLMDPCNHRQSDVTLRFHIKKGPKIKQIEKVLHHILLLMMIGVAGHNGLWWPIGLLLMIIRAGRRRPISGKRDLVALYDMVDLFINGDRERLTKLLELIDKGRDDRFGTKDLLLFLVDRFALGDGLLHLDDAVEFLMKSSESLVDEVKNRSVWDIWGLHGGHCRTSEERVLEGFEGVLMERR